MEQNEFDNPFGELSETQSKKHGKYLTFTPNKLPPNIQFDKQLAYALANAESAISKLSGLSMLFSNPDLMTVPYLKKEALSSSRIEGTRVSLDQYLLAEAQNTQKESTDTLEVLNYLESMHFALKEIKDKPINLELIKKMHQHLMKNVRGEKKLSGKFRKIQNWIGYPGSKPATAYFVPPKPQKIDNLMQEMMQYMDAYDQLPLLIKCALMHYQFETIHPFYDGNGRIGRALIILYLIKKNKISKHTLYLSGFFEKNRNQYSRLLLDTNRNGKFKKWILFFLEAIKTQSEEATEKAIRLHKLREKYRQLAQEETQSNDMLIIVDQLFLIPYITIKKASSITKKTYPTSKKTVNTLIKLGILKETNKNAKRKKIYMAQEILETISN